MIFTGDVAIAYKDFFHFVGFDALREKPWCINLEGAVLEKGAPVPSWGTYNWVHWFESFSDFELAPVFLANNHIHDLDRGVEITQDYLFARNLRGFGAGIDRGGAAAAVTTQGVGQNYTLLGFGWPVIGCKPADEESPGVNRLEGRDVLTQAREALEKEDSGKVVVVIHGNYEFEKYPQPAHRKLARQLIDEGAYAVVCHHPHIVSPVERYKGRTIAYSLGNWAFSYGRFFSGNLKFPEASFHQIALELSEDGDKVHHAEFNPPNSVHYLRTEHVWGEEFSLRPDFEGFDDAAYLNWFRKNRVKKKGLPIYKDSNASFGNSLRDMWVFLRQRMIEAAVIFRFKKLDRS